MLGRYDVQACGCYVDADSRLHYCATHQAAPRMLDWLRRYAPTTCVYDYPAPGPKPQDCRCAGCEARAILGAAR